MTKTYGDLQHDAVMLSAAVGGLDVLVSNLPSSKPGHPEERRAANALNVYVIDCIERAQLLADEMDVFACQKLAEPQALTGALSSMTETALRERAGRSECVLTELLCLSDALQIITWDLNGATVDPELEQTRDAIVGVSQAMHKMLKNWEEQDSSSSSSSQPNTEGAPTPTLEAAE